jgi:pimeloyl-ACP methyl ester carboxylesterase
VKIRVDDVTLFVDVDGAEWVAGSHRLVQRLAVFERGGGPAAREAARRYLGGDLTPEAAAAWETHALPVYGEDPAPRRARALINDEVQTHFRKGGCGSPDADAVASRVRCRTLILAGADDPVCPAAGADRLAGLLINAEVERHVLPGVGHGVFRQAPDGAFALVRAWLR